MISVVNCTFCGGVVVGDCYRSGETESKKESGENAFHHMRIMYYAPVQKALNR